MYALAYFRMLEFYLRILKRNMHHFIHAYILTPEILMIMDLIHLKAFVGFLLNSEAIFRMNVVVKLFVMHTHSILISANKIGR